MIVYKSWYSCWEDMKAGLTLTCIGICEGLEWTLLCSSMVNLELVILTFFIRNKHVDARRMPKNNARTLKVWDKISLLAFAGSCRGDHTSIIHITYHTRVLQKYRFKSKILITVWGYWLLFEADVWYNRCVMCDTTDVWCVTWCARCVIQQL